MREIEYALDAHYYTDPAIYVREQQGLLAKTWQYAGHISQLQNRGDYITFSIAEQSLFCIRDRDEEIRCFYNVCQHRAHELLEGAGKVRALICPYHGWGYDFDGRFRGGPNTETIPQEAREKICLTSVRLENFNGFLFVNLDPDAQPMDIWFPGARAELASFVPDIEALRIFKQMDVPEACNWKVSVENYSECYHCRLRHPTFATGVIKPDTYDIQPQGHCLRHTTECQNLDKMTYEVDLSSNVHAGDYSSWFLWPMFSFQVYPGNVLNTYHWRPNGADRVTVHRGWYAAVGADQVMLEKLAQQDMDTTVAEDISLVESVQRGLKSTGYRPGPLVLDPAGGVNSEHSIKALKSWYLDMMA